MRSGVIAQKLGMSRLFTDDGRHVGVTVLKIDQCEVVAQRTLDRDGYTAVQLGVVPAKVKRVSKAMRGHFAKAKVEPKKRLGEFRVAEDCLLEPGVEIAADHFAVGQFVDVTGTSIGKGFAGGMKRHNFSGLEATHGVSISHRAHGSTGQCQDPGRVFKGKKMAGQLGNKRATVQSLEVVATDPDKGLVMVKGGVPGSKKSFVMITDAVKRKLPEGVPMPAAIKEKAEAAQPQPDAAPEEAMDQDSPAQETPSLETSTEASGEDSAANAAPVNEPVATETASADDAGADDAGSDDAESGDGDKTKGA